MPAGSSQSSKSLDLPWWPVAAAIGVLAVAVALALGLTGPPADEPPAVAGAAGERPDVSGSDAGRGPRFVPPRSPVTTETAAVHWVGSGTEAGVKVVYVQVLSGGEVMVLDAATGRLIETRPFVRAK